MKNTLIWALVALVVLGGIWFLASRYKSSDSGNNSYDYGTNSETDTNTTSTPTSTVTAKTVTVTYAAGSFSPKSVTVNKGDTVTWVNNTSGDMWVASAAHPTHTVYGGTTLSQHCPDTAGIAFDACAGVAKSQSWSFTFNKAGTWNYHDHLHASNFGTIVVTQ